MVRNTHGGNKSKGFARKNLIKRDTALRVAQEEGEIYAQAVKVLGGSFVSAIDIDGSPLRAHIRGKFRGRGKRDNFIGPGTWLLVGLHSWEGDKSSDMRNCDVLEVYNESDKTRLKNSVTSVNWSKFIANDTKTLANNTTEETDEQGIVFMDDVTQEYEELIHQEATTKIRNVIIDENDEQIDVDDI